MHGRSVRFPNPFPRTDQQVQSNHQQPSNMNFLQYLSTNFIFNWFMSSSQPSMASVHVGDDHRTVGLQSVLEEDVRPSGVFSAHGNRSEVSADGTNNIFVPHGANGNVVGLMAAIGAGTGNGVVLQVSVQPVLDPAPFPVHRIIGVSRARRLACRRPSPPMRRLVIH